MMERKIRIFKGADNKYRIFIDSPFGSELIEQIRGTHAFKTRKSAEKRLQSLKIRNVV